MSREEYLGMRLHFAAPVIARSEATKQSHFSRAGDCFAGLAMTRSNLRH